MLYIYVIYMLYNIYMLYMLYIYIYIYICYICYIYVIYMLYIYIYMLYIYMFSDVRYTAKFYHDTHYHTITIRYISRYKYQFLKFHLGDLKKV